MGSRTTTESALEADIPIFYKAIFLYVEPAMVCFAAFMGYYDPLELFSMLTRTSYSSSGTPAQTIEMIHQLSNEFLLVAVLQAGILRATSERIVWKVFLASLLVADAVHLYNLGKVGLGLSEGVLVGMAIVRIAFLLGH